MLGHLTFLLLCCLSVTVDAVQLPTYFTICNKENNFKQCALDNIDKNWKNIVEKGEKSVKLANLQPMKLTKMNVQASPTLKVDFSNLEFRGFETCMATDINMDLASEDFSLKSQCQYFEMIGTYDLNGKILILPIQGHGNINLTLVKFTLEFNTKLEIIEKDGESYYNISPLKVKTLPERVYYNLDNLFNGDKRLGDEMNKFLNENWKDVYEEIGPAITATVGVIITTIINAYFNNIPANQLHH